MNQRKIVLGILLAATVVLAFWPGREEDVAIVGAVRRADVKSDKNAVTSVGAGHAVTASAERFTPLSGDLFPAQSWRPPPPKYKPRVVQPPPPPPSPPDFPFEYFGRWSNAGKEIFFLEQDEQLTRVSPGDVVAEEWRLDKATPNSLVFTYLPLEMTKTLRITR